MSFEGNIHFFKKIEEDTLRNGELRIPRSFVNKCWEGISNPVHILLQNGAKWEVNWKKIDADVWLSNNWKKFAESYDLDQDHLVVFKYVGKSKFQVVILDQSALEIRYPLLEPTSNVEESGNSLRRSNKRAQSPLPFSHSTKKVKSNPRKEPNHYHSQDVETARAESSRRTRLEMKKFHTDFDNAKHKYIGGRGMRYANRRCSMSEVSESEEELEDIESSSALERAKAFTSVNPFFIREMFPTYIQRYVLSIPGHFITTHQQKENDCVTLWVSDERTNWDVKFKLNHSNGQANLSTGWKKFVEDNDLKLGDVCVFEQTKTRRNSFRVVIYRDREESGPSLLQAHGDRANPRKPPRLQNNFAERGCEEIPNKYSRTVVFNDSEFPGYNNKMSQNHFSLTINTTQSNVKNIPIKFMRDHVIDNVNDVTLRVGKRSWPVTLVYYAKHGFGRFSAGWSTFVRECRLEEGDRCLFELVDEENFVFEVKVSSRCIA